MSDEDRKILERILQAQLTEQRRARRWKIFFRLVFFIALPVFVIVMVTSPPGDYTPLVNGKHAALVKLEGPIFSNFGSDVVGGDADSAREALRLAFESEDAQIVILEINTPGGSPVQSAYIADEILRLRKKYPDKLLYAVVADICASGGMYAAVVADEVYADPASLIGSIGVVLGGFGFVEAIDKLGIERRLMTAGKNKALLDPFLPKDPAHAAHAQKLLDQIHAQFIERVKEGRKGKLDENADLFDGLFWTGEEALELGLIDGFGDVRHVAEELNGLEEIVEYKAHTKWWSGLSTDFGAAIATRLFHLLTQPMLH